MNVESEKPVNILLIEDNDDHIELTKRALEENGVSSDISVAKDGEEALDLLYNKGEHSNRTKAPRPSLVLLDVNLPKIDGFEVLRHIKGDPDLKSIPVILLTTSSRDEDIVKGYAEGANSYVTKPVDFNDFVAKINNIRLYWTLVNSLPSVHP